MKELKVKVKGLHLVKKRPQQCLSLPSVKPKQSITAIETLQPQQELAQQNKIGRQRLAAQAQKINQLSVELEAAMLELKAIANDIKREQRSIRATLEPIKSMCEYSAAIVPHVRHKKGGAFVLTTRSVDLFRAEREAKQVAQSLRRRAKTKKTSTASKQVISGK